MAKAVVHVAVGVIRNQQQQVLLALRPSSKHQGGLWEFPGGKLEVGETASEALVRELQEELSITATEYQPLIDLEYAYPDLTVRLDVWEITGFQGVAEGAEGQPVRWVDPSDLGQYAFPAANQPIVHAVQLPKQYWITPDLPAEQLWQGLERAVQQGAQLIQLRAPSLNLDAYQQLAEQAMQHWPMVNWLLKYHPEQAFQPSSRLGFHLTSQQLIQLTEDERAQFAEGWLAASCHNQAEIMQANQLGIDFISLSPVLPTASHPQQTGLGFERAAELTRLASCPVFWLGGMQLSQQTQVQQFGAQGIAAIRSLWDQ